MGSNGKSAVQDLIARCEAVGWTVVKTNSNHYKVDTRKGTFTLPCTPSSDVSVRNSVAEALRHGLEDLEAKLQLRDDKQRLRRIADDRAANDARMARLEAKVRQFSRTGSVDVDTEKLTSDPTKDIGLGLVNGIAIVAIAPAMVKTPIMSEPRPLTDAEELLLANEAIVYRCRRVGPWGTGANLKPDELCRATFSTPNSLRTHIRFHTTRAKSDATALPPIDQVKEKETERSEVPKTTTAPAAIAAPAETVTTTDELKAGLTIALTDLVTKVDRIGAETIDARNEIIKIVDLVRSLKPEIIVQEPDPELVAKAAQFDALATTLGSLINPAK